MGNQRHSGSTSHFLNRLMSVPELTGDEDSLRVARALYSVAIGVSLLQILVLAAVIFIGERKIAGSLLILMGQVASYVAVHLVRQGQVRRASLIYVSSWWVIVAVFALLSNGTSTIASYFFISVIVMSMALLGKSASLTATAVSLGYTLGLNAAQSLGYSIPQYFPVAGFVNWALLAYGVLLALIPVMSINRSLHEALAYSEQQLKLRQQAEQSLSESEARFRTIFDLSPEAILISDAKGRITRLNPAALNQMGKVSAGEVIGHDAVELGLVETSAMQSAIREQINAEGGTLTQQELPLFSEPELPQTALFSTRAIELDGAPHFLTIAVDITNRKRAELLLQQENELIEAIINTLPGVFFFYDISDDANGKLLRWNHNLERVSSYSAVELSKMRVLDWVTVEESQPIMEAIGATRHQPVVQFEAEVLDKEKRPTPYLFSISSMQVGERRYLLGSGIDITNRKQTESALQASEDRYRIISEMMWGYAYAGIVHPDGSLEQDWITDDSFQRMTGYSWAEVGTQFTLYHPDDVERARADVAATVSGNETSGEYRIITKGGRVLWLFIRRKAVWSADKRRIVRYFGAAEDITERKLAETALRRSEASMRALLDATTDVAFLMAVDGTVLTANKSMAQYMKLSVEAMVGRIGFDLLPPDLREARQAHFDVVIETGEPERWEDATSVNWWDNSIYPVLSPTGEVEAFAIYSRNVSDRKRLEAELQNYTQQLERMVEERTTQLRRAKEQIELILNNTSDALALSQPDGDIQLFNPAFLAMFDEETAQTIEHILRTISSDEQIVAVGGALLQVIYDSEMVRVEAQILGSDGKDKDVDLAMTPIRTASQQDRAGILISARDITHLKEIERFKAQFVADAVHDLATPISALSTRLYTLKRTPERLEEHIKALENQVQHLRDLLTDLRTLSQLDRGQISLKLELCDLNELAQRVFDTYEPIAQQKQQSLTLTTDPALPLLKIDRRQFERVLVNLVSNAINYTPNGKSVDVQTAITDEGVTFSVTDQGIGIAPDDLPKIFDRFYRTDEARRTESGGTGLGLAIVKQIVELHGGTITAASEPHEGSTFTIKLRA